MHTKNYNIITTVGSSVSVDGIWIYIYIYIYINKNTGNK